MKNVSFIPELSHSENGVTVFSVQSLMLLGDLKSNADNFATSDNCSQLLKLFAYINIAACVFLNSIYKLQILHLRC